MTSVHQKYISPVGLVAGASLAAKQYHGVKAASTAGQVISVAASTDVVIGIVQNDAASGEPADVAMLGVALAIAGTSTITLGETLRCNSTGRMIETTTDNGRRIAVALQASGADGDEISVLLTGADRY